jgi:hypothetical protein
MNNELVVKASVPAQVRVMPDSQFNLNYNNDLVTHVQLRVFYQGMTADRRLFTEDFSDKLLQTLPQTPVVGYFDEESEDFIGHNHSQFIYGYVPENAKFGFEQDQDGTKWAVTDIILFTGRKDNIGTVAQKIIGKQHSLELEASSMKYKIKKDKKGNFDYIELQDGKFIGLSVLGDNQSPAFEGSEFFVEKTPELQTCVEDISRHLSYFNTNDKSTDGGEEVNTDTTLPSILKDLREFMKQTTDEFETELTEALYSAFGDYVFILQWSFEDSQVVFMDMEDGKYYRVDFQSEGEMIEFSEKLEVKVRFLTKEEIDATFENENTDGDSEEDSNLIIMPINDVENNTVTTTNSILDIPSTADNTEENTEDDNNETRENGIFISESELAQIETDRAELEKYRKETKVNIINQYADFIDAAEKAKFIEEIDQYTVFDLETALSTSAMKKILKEKQEESKKKQKELGGFGIRTTPILPKNSNSESNLANLVGRYKSENK